MKHTIATVAVTLCVAACMQDGPHVASQVGESNELWSTRLRTKVCQQIVQREGVVEHDGKCSGFSYTVVDSVKSTRYAHQNDGRPVTMQLTVDVENPESGFNYDAVLTRTLNGDFELVFAAQVAKTGVEQLRTFISAVAGADWDDPRLRRIGFGALPADILAKATDELESRRDWFCRPGDPCPHDADFGEDGFAEILMEGEVVGYLVPIWDWIDDPHWDGSGVDLLYDRYATLVTDREWSM